MTDSTLTSKVRAFRALRKRRDAAVEKADKLSAEYDKAQAELFRLMKDEDVTSVTSGGVHFVRTSTTYAQVQDKSALIEWAQENEPELVAPAPRKGLLNAKARECLDNGEPLPPGMGVYEREYISQRTG
jgi:hypothetical protein